MISLTLLAMCVVSVELFIGLNLHGQAVSIMVLSRETVDVLRSTELQDDEKESFSRRRAVESLTTTVTLVAKLSIIILALYFIYLLAIEVSSVSEAALLDGLTSPTVIGVWAAFMACYVLLRNAILQRL